MTTLYIVQHPMNGRLLASDRRTFIFPGTPGEVWSTADAEEAGRAADVVGGKAIPIEPPPQAPRMPMAVPPQREGKRPRPTGDAPPAVKVSV